MKKTSRIFAQFVSVMRAAQPGHLSCPETGGTARFPGIPLRLVHQAHVLLGAFFYKAGDGASRHVPGKGQPVK